MKNIKIALSTIFTLLLLAGASSCESLLEEKVYTSKDESIYNSDETAIAAVNGIYEVFQSHFYMRSHYYEMLMMISPAYTRNSKQRGKEPLTNFMHSPEESTITRVWEQIYKAINRSNDVLVNLDNDNVSIDLELRDRLVGEALFLRGLNYFNLVRIYGGVPITTNATKTFEDSFKGRASVEDVYAQIILDLERAYQLLPVTQYDKGRATKYASAALLSKVYLTMAGTDNQYWDDALTWGKIVYDEGNYQLVDDFNDLWGGPVTALKNSVESIFEIQFSAGETNGNSIPRLTYPNAGGEAPVFTGNGWGKIRVTKKAYDAFETGDYRQEVTFAGADLVKCYPTTGYHTANQGWPYIRKFFDAEAIDNNDHRCNLPYLRYADLLLMLAEAENEVNGPTEAFKYVDEVLARARKADGTPRTVPADWDRSLTQDEFREMVLKERHKELLGEVHSWYDLIRRGSEHFIQYLREVENHPNNDPGMDPEWPEADDYYTQKMLFPIPAEEIAANPLITVADQNPSY